MDSAGARAAKQPKLNLKEHFQLALVKLESAAAEKDINLLVEALEEFRAFFRGFEQELRAGLQALNPKYCNILEEWKVLREEYSNRFDELADSMDPPVKPLELAKLPSIRKKDKTRPTSPSAADKSKAAAEKAADKTAADGEVSTNVPVNPRPRSASAPRPRPASVKASAAVPAHGPAPVAAQGAAQLVGKPATVGHVSQPGTRGGRLSGSGSKHSSRDSILDLDTMTVSKATRIFRFKKGTLEELLRATKQNPTEANLDLLRDSWTHDTEFVDQLRDWVFNSAPMGDQQEDLFGPAMAQFEITYTAVKVFLQESGWDLNHLNIEEDNDERVQSWVRETHGVKVNLGNEDGRQLAKKLQAAGAPGDPEPPGSSSSSSVASSAGGERPRNRRRMLDDLERRFKRLKAAGLPDGQAAGPPAGKNPPDKPVPAVPEEHRIAPKNPRPQLEISPEQIVAAMGWSGGRPAPIKVKLQFPDSFQGSTKVDLGVAGWLKAEALLKAVPPFSGSLSEYPIWKDAAVNYITEAKEVPSATQLQQLKATLSGEAATLVRCISAATTAPLAVLIDTLDEEYGNRYAIIDSQRNKLLSLKKPKQTYAGWRDFLLELNEIRAVCSKAGRSLDSDIQAVKHVLATLPPSWRSKFHEKYAGDDDKRLDTIAHFLRYRVDTERAEERWRVDPPASKDSKDVKQSSSSKASKPIVCATVGNTGGAAPSKGTDSSGDCFACKKKGHELEDCKVFLELTIDKRWEIVKAAPELHKRCLKVHERYKCDLPKEQRGCPVDESCTWSHHALLHTSGGNKKRKWKKKKSDKDASSSSTGSSSSSAVPAQKPGNQ